LGHVGGQPVGLGDVEDIGFGWREIRNEKKKKEE